MGHDGLLLHPQNWRNSLIIGVYFIWTRAKNLYEIFMGLAGFFLLFTGWLLVLAAIALLRGTALAAFTLAGFAVQVLGLVQVVRAHIIPQEEKP